MRAKVERIGGHHFRFSVRGMSGDIDVPLEAKAKPLGPTPKDLLLAALCGCTGTDVIDLLAKFAVNYDSLQLEARAELTEKHPKVFASIDLSYMVNGKNVDSEKVKEAVQRSTHQYSGVAAMLAKNNPINYRVFVNDQEVVKGQVDFGSHSAAER